VQHDGNNLFGVSHGFVLHAPHGFVLRFLYHALCGTAGLAGAAKKK